MSGVTEINDDSRVPLRWLVLTVGTAISCLGASLYLAFLFGSLTTGVITAQKDEGERITSLENNAVLGRGRYADIVQRLSKLEAQNEIILKEIRRRE